VRMRAGAPPWDIKGVPRAAIPTARSVAGLVIK
jgi:hypothetical protein